MPSTTLLQYTNKVLTAINEPVLTSANFANAVGIPLAAQYAVNDAIKDIVAAELEWPFVVSSYSQTLTPGTGQYALPTYRSVDWNSFFIDTTNIATNGEFTSNITSWTDVSGAGCTAAYTSTGNGRLRLTGTGSLNGAANQALTTVQGRTYKVLVRILGSAVVVRVGTSNGGTELYTGTLALTTAGNGNTYDFQFTATGTTTYLGFYNSSATAADVDFVRVREGRSARALEYISFDVWRKSYKEGDNALSSTSMDYPLSVYKTKDDKFGVTPIPDQDNYEVTFDYWTIPTDLSAYGDTCLIPDRYSQVLVEGAKRYVYTTLSDPVFRDRAVKDFDNGIKMMRTELINRPDRMSST